MRNLGLNDSQILTRMMVSTSKDIGDFDLPQTADISKLFYLHDQKYLFLKHIGTSKDEHVLIEFLKMFPIQGKSFHDMFKGYLSNDFEERKAVAINIISTLIKSETKGYYIYTILNSLCHSCDEVYSVFEGANSNFKIEFGLKTNLFLLYEILKPDLFAKLFINKSGPSFPIKGQIQNKTWLSRAITSLLPLDLDTNKNKKIKGKI